MRSGFFYPSLIRVTRSVLCSIALGKSFKMYVERLLVEMKWTIFFWADATPYSMVSTAVSLPTPTPISILPPRAALQGCGFRIFSWVCLFVIRLH